MITPSNNMIPPYDPLAVQFMTGQQMEYMPNAQFLTPSNYGAFRTMPGPNTGVMPMQQPSLWQNYQIMSRGNMFGMLPDYALNNFQLGVDQSLYRTMALRRVQDAKSSFGAVAGGMGANFGISALLGMGNPLLGMGISAMLPDMAAPFVDRVGMQRKIQDWSMSKITSGRDVAAGLGQGFGLEAASSIDEFVRKQAAGDLLFKEDDYRSILKTGVESGLFDYDNSATEYKRRIKQLRDNISGMADMLESTDFKELMGSMKRLLTMGADMTQALEVTQMERLFSRMTGMRHGAMVSAYGQQGALTYSQMGMTAYQGSLTAMSHAANITLSQRLGILDPGTLARHGGISGLTQDLTEQQGRGIRNSQKSFLPFFANESLTGLSDDFSGKMSDFLEGKVGLSDLTAQGAMKLNSAENAASYYANEQKIQQQLEDELGPAGMELFMMQLAKQRGSAFGAVDTKDQLLLGYASLDYDFEVAGQLAEMQSNPEYLEAKSTQLKTERRRRIYDILEKQKNNNSWYKKTWVAIKEADNKLQAPYKRWARESALRKQMEENAELGIVSVPGFDFAGGIADMTTNEYATFSENLGLDVVSNPQLLEDVSTREDLFLSLGRDKSLLSSGFVKDENASLGWRVNMPGLSDEIYSEAIPDDTRAAIIAHGKNIFTAGSTTRSEEESIKTLAAFKDQFSVTSLVAQLKGAEDISAISDEGLRKILQQSIFQSTDMSKLPAKPGGNAVLDYMDSLPSKADAILQQDNVKESILSLARNAGSDALQTEINERYTRGTKEVGLRDAKAIADWQEDFRDRLGEVTTQSGFWKIDDIDQLDLLENTLKKDIRGLDVYAMQALHTKIMTMPVADPRRKETIARYKQHAARAGIQEEDAENLLSDHRGINAPGIQKTLGRLNLKEDDLRDLSTAGTKTGSQRGFDAIDFSKDVESLERERLTAETGLITQTMRNVIKQRSDVTMADLRDDETRKKLLQRAKDTDDDDLRNVVLSVDAFEKQQIAGVRSTLSKHMKGFKPKDLQDQEALSELLAQAKGSKDSSFVEIAKAIQDIKADKQKVSLDSIGERLQKEYSIEDVAAHTGRAFMPAFKDLETLPTNIKLEEGDQSISTLNRTIEKLDQSIFELRRDLAGQHELTMRTLTKIPIEK
jgi:hypothetical protein